MKQKDVVELFTTIENSCDVNKISWNGIKLWPLLRLNLWCSLLLYESESEDSHNPPAEINSKRYKLASSVIYSANKVKKYIVWLYEDIKYRIWLRKITHESIDALFLYYEDERYHEAELCYANRHLDPMVELSISLGYFASKVVFKKGGNSFIRKHCELSNLIELDIGTCKRPTFRFQIMYLISNLEGIPVIDEINKILPEPSRINLDSLFNQIDSLNDHVVWFTKLLTSLRPRVIFYTCYYRIETMAMNHVCKLANIKSIDVQHGKQGKYHGLYSHWTNLPADGYELLPDYFWNWGEEAKRNIQQYRMPDYPLHKSHIGGYLWLEKIVSEHKEAKGLPGKIEEKIIKSEKTILVSLQPTPDSPTSNLIKAMAVSPKKWLWLVRLHPRQMDSLEQIKQELEANGVTNYEMDISSTCSLYAMFPYVDYHVTAWSTVLIEALVFQVPTIIITPQGYELYKDKIEEGVFWYASKSEDILELLSGRQLVVKENAHEEYFVLDKEVSSKLFSDIMNDRELLYG